MKLNSRRKPAEGLYSMVRTPEALLRPRLSPRERYLGVGQEAALTLREEFTPDAPRANGRVHVIDLFCGCGGLSLGFEYFGRRIRSYRISAAVDFDEHAAATYSRNLPVRPTIADLTDAVSSDRKWRALGLEKAKDKGPLVLIGGPPCQGFSAHGKKNRQKTDERNHLILVYAEIVRRLQPDLALLENVPELLAKKHWHIFVRFRATLAAAGYATRAQVHNLATFGVPQERFRALVVASRRPFRMPVPFVGPDAYATVRDAIGGLPPVSPGEIQSEDPEHVCSAHRPSTIRTIRMVPPNGGRRPAGVGPACLDRVDGFRDVYGRLFWDRPANTITAYARNPASGRYVHPEQHRGLTVREAALLQGFPRRFRFEGPFDHKFLQVGNAVPPIFSTYLAAHFFAELLHPMRANEIDPTVELDIEEPASNSFSSGIAGRKKVRSA